MMRDKQKTLREYVREMADTESGKKVFGFSKKGNLISSWCSDLERLEFYFGLVISCRWINIFVPTTRSGIAPLNTKEQPYGWKGFINEALAEQAVWWAFEILTEDEARQFMAEHNPEIIFSYIIESRPFELRVRFNGEDWIIIEE